MDDRYRYHQAEAYGPEFDQQWSHFDSQMEMFKLKPQKPSSSFGEQVTLGVI